MNGIKTYFNNIERILDSVLESQGEAMEAAARCFADAIEQKRSIYVFGCSHGAILSEEMFYRAGGLAVINPLFNPSLMLNVRPVTLTSRFERLEGQSKALLEESSAKDGDVILIHSVSGRNGGIVEMALEAKAMNMTVMGITNMAYSKKNTSRHSSGKRLFELCDICIDNGGEFGDGCVEIKGIHEKAGATSTVIGTSVANGISVRAAEILAERGIQPPVLHSANADGGDEINKRIFEEYKGCIHYL